MHSVILYFIQNFIMRYLLVIALSFVFFTSNAQTLDPVSWDAELVHVDGDEYKLLLTANIDTKWVIYSQYLGNDGPIPTTFSVDKSEDIQLIGEFSEPNNPIVEMDEMFGMKLTKFKEKAVFEQQLKISKKDVTVTGTVEYMTCDSKRCLPPSTVSFTARTK